MTAPVVQLLIANKKKPSGAPGTPPILSLQSAAERPKSLRDGYAQYLAGNTTYPILVSLQPNTLHGAPIHARPSPDAKTPEDRLWAMVEQLFHELDRLHTGCPRPAYLKPEDRFQGFVIVEKRGGNIHVHILITCRDWWDQYYGYLKLFDLLDTAPDGDRQDSAQQADTWDFLVAKGWLSERSRTRRHSPLLHRLAPGATTTVQRIRTLEDKLAVCDYLTKEVGKTSSHLAGRSDYWARKADFGIRELREFHSSAWMTAPATNIRIDPVTGCKTLNLDDLSSWRAGGKRLRH